ncbi:MAG: response regulator transcription factor, partial [Cellulosilyticaceae bacterium]
MGYRVLVCDDDDNIAQSIAIYLQQDGYEVLIAHNGIECLELLRSQDVARNGEIHLVILDVMMPELDGISTLFNLRKEYNVPVIMLSAKSESTDKITGLSFGADDYVTKPCDMLELLARVKSNLRRYTTLGNKKKEEDVLVVGELSIDKRFDKVMMGDKMIKLTPTEYKILCY